MSDMVGGDVSWWAWAKGLAPWILVPWLLAIALAFGVRLLW